VFGFLGSTWEGQLQKFSYKFYQKNYKRDLHWHSNYFHFEIPTIFVKTKLSIHIRTTMHL
jgi:hypothetical protein